MQTSVKGEEDTTKSVQSCNQVEARMPKATWARCILKWDLKDERQHCCKGLGNKLNVGNEGAYDDPKRQPNQQARESC